METAFFAVVQNFDYIKALNATPCTASYMNHFLFVAAENDALAHCKAGGMGDVVRDVPRQIVKRGDRAHVIVPSYSRLHHTGYFKMQLHFTLRGLEYTAALYEAQPKKAYPNLTHYVLHHPEIEAGDIAQIYHNDPEEPFYTDAIKYSVFCTAVAEAIKQGAFGDLDVVHLHDWHTSLLLFLRAYHPEYKPLKGIRFVYSIHNLAIQGIRPFAGNYSSLQNWFPSIPIDRPALMDYQYQDCVNLMAVGIRFADAVHTVSPSYRDDIILPSIRPEFVGGEGLEKDLQQAHKAGKLFGILNGCNYKNINSAKKGHLYKNMMKALLRWMQEEPEKYKTDFLAHTAEKVMDFMDDTPRFIAASVARLTEQKFYLFMHSPEAFVEILKQLERIGGIFILLGTGDPAYEALFRKLSYQHKNVIFTNGQCEKLVDSIYLESDLYCMPSLFEPCGISQMLAMRNGTPCLVHHTGGLKDTVTHLETGFSFDGKDVEEKIENMIKTLNVALELYKNDAPTWKKIKATAKKKRFTWQKSVDAYYQYLYKVSKTPCLGDVS